MREVLREVCKGQGYKVVDIPFPSIAKNPAVKIRNLNDYQAVVQTLIDGFTDKDWLDLFEHGVINKFGYAITYDFSHHLDKKCNRFMVLLHRPAKIDDSPLGQMFVFGDELVKETFGDEYELAKISILMSPPEAEEQVRHTDYEGKVATSDDKNTDFALIVAFKVDGSVCVWPFTQHMVQASAEIKREKDRRKHVSLLREQLQSNGNFKIGFDDCEKKVVTFGPSEMLIIGGNTVHSGAKNTMYCTVYRVHYYVTLKGREAPNNQTVVLDEVVWDKTRKGAESVDVVFPEFETVEEYDEYKAEKEGNEVPSPSSSAKRGRSRKEQQAKAGKRGRGRPRKVIEAPVKRGRGRPRKVQNSSSVSNASDADNDSDANDDSDDSDNEDVQPVKRGRGRPRKVQSSSSVNNASDADNNSDANDDSDNEDVQPVKRGRGRPRKNT